MESLEVIATPESSCFWTLGRVWSCLIAAPSHKCTLSQAQSKLH